MLSHLVVGASVGFAMWIPTQDEAIEMYARFLAARHGRAAAKYARLTADRLHARGDFAGHQIWGLVADVIERRPPKRAKVDDIPAAS